MKKIIVKELTIIGLIAIVILMLLVIVFYDYIPIGKVTPANVVAHEIPNEIEEELTNLTVTGEQDIVKTYVVTSSDLGLYESSQNYDKGKENPFSISSEYEPKTFQSNELNNINLIENDNNIENKVK